MKSTEQEIELQRLEKNGLIKAINTGRKGREYDFDEGIRYYDHNGKKYKLCIELI